MLLARARPREERVVRGRLDDSDVGDPDERELLTRVVDLTVRGPEPHVAARPHPRPEVDVCELQLFCELAAKRVFERLAAFERAARSDPDARVPRDDEAVEEDAVATVEQDRASGGTDDGQTRARQLLEPVEPFRPRDRGVRG